MINEGIFGKILCIQSIRWGVHPPQIIKSEVGLDLGIHDVDLANYFLDSYPTSKYVVNKKFLRQNINDLALISLEYKDNILVHIHTNWLSPIKVRIIWILGTNASVKLNLLSQKLTIYYTSLLECKNGNSYIEVVNTKYVNKKVYSYNTEPLKHEILYFLKNLHNESDFDLLKSAIKSLEVFV
jgi:UDP-N-acetylglucosamine 3-dehydrogenase